MRNLITIKIKPDNSRTLTTSKVVDNWRVNSREITLTTTSKKYVWYTDQLVILLTCQ